MGIPLGRSSDAVFNQGLDVTSCAQLECAESIVGFIPEKRNPSQGAISGQ